MPNDKVMKKHQAPPERASPAPRQAAGVRPRRVGRGVPEPWPEKGAGGSAGGPSTVPGYKEGASVGRSSRSTAGGAAGQLKPKD
jgi:hypothetical protein